MNAISKIGLGLLASTALLAASAPAFAAGLSRENCFEGAQVADWVVAGDNAIFLQTRTQDYYRIDLASKVRLRTPGSQVVITSNNKTVCTGADLHVVQSTLGTLGVAKITKLTDDEIAAAGLRALPGRHYRGD
jgi:hypothetical protein